MKLVFPGGEHPQVLLGPGVNRVGSDPGSNIVLDTPGVLPQHCQLHVSATGVMLEVPSGTTVSVNGRHVDGLIALRPGDSVTFDHVLARLAAIDAVAPRGGDGGYPHAANDDPGVTAVRHVVPMYVLRGVTGGAFGRSYPLQGPVTIGRSPECDIHINDLGLSRVHARLIPGEDGVTIEDLNSTNGTSLNDRRVIRERARMGDEIGFDKLRFRLVGAAGHEPVQVEATKVHGAPRGSSWLWIGLVIAVAAAVITIVVSNG
ncbi:pSer/pThr/pTyr-binding forkhead associated (FHA) protein [Lysobacter niabensis]|jgi:pSer/pThr/pTyr-binding forkhead associated (FHA) protein|uniref:PSer/pThr/pTyr-binding forkhead associated (FHA) protein n=1 Tax=Agrilutibacter niabensis TaxID=380628 RepID=A0ABU1VKU0_9GAMM|nr:FHA domain-containing protein [Lysobacter niabensis]MDR7098079.1 pSer/pThr/pTyr-binding forkhead associated (FHA) protein [Lysobacter niabensis]